MGHRDSVARFPVPHHRLFDKQLYIEVQVPLAFHMIRTAQAEIVRPSAAEVPRDEKFYWPRGGDSNPRLPDLFVWLHVLLVCVEACLACSGNTMMLTDSGVIRMRPIPQPLQQR